MEEAERKIQVLKAAVVKLTRQKTEADEKRAQIAEELDAERRRSAQLADELAHARVEHARVAAAQSATTSASAGSRWKIFNRGSDSAAQQATPATDATVLSDLILQNERLHEELFDVRTALEKRAKTAEAQLKELRGQHDALQAELETLKASSQTLAQESHSTSPTLPRNKSWSPAHDVVEASPQALAVTLTDARFVIRFDDAQVLAPPTSAALALFVETLIAALNNNASSNARVDDVSDRFFELESAMGRHLERIAKLWSNRGRVADCHIELATSFRSLCLLLADSANLICRSLASLARISEADARAAARALQSFLIGMGNSCRSLNLHFVMQYDKTCVTRWKMVENFVRGITAAVRDEAPTLHAALDELVEKVTSVMECSLPERHAAPPPTLKLSQRVRDILGAVDVHYETTATGSSAWSASQDATTSHSAASERGESSSPMILPRLSPQESTVQRWLRLADDQAVYWRRQFEISMAELEERTLAFEARGEEIGVLKQAVAKEKRELEWTTKALQTQIEVLSEQLANLTAPALH